MKKRGLSTVVTTLIIILLVLVAIGIIWVVIANLIEEGTEEISLGKFTVSLDIKEVTVNPGSISVKVKRNPGQGELSAISFIIDDGSNTQVFEQETNLQELGEKTFTLNYTGLVKEVSIAPVFKSESGKSIIGSELDNQMFNNKEVIENLGGVSWWRFEGNANDELGINPGTLMNGVDCSTQGKFGQACSFDGVDDYVDIGGFDFPSLEKTWAVFIWAKISSSQNSKAGIWAIDGGHTLYINTIPNSVCLHWNSCVVNTIIPNDVWNNLLVIREGDNFIFYLDGVEISTGSTSITTTNTRFMLGTQTSTNYFLNGLIDEAIIFNRPLSQDEITALYNLDLRNS